MVRTFVIAILALVLSGCAVDDSGPVRSLFRPADGSPVLSDVVYVTDREPDPAFPGGYATRWAGKPSCGTAQTQIPAALVVGEEQKWGYVAKTHPATCASGKNRLGGAIALIEAQAKARHCRSVLLFVHGFHTGFDGGVLRAAQMAHDAQTGCAVAAFSWSAEIAIDRYVTDLEHSDYAQPLLAEFLRELSESGLRVTVLAHSLGCRLTLMTLSGLGQDREPPRPGFIDELVLAAGDIGIEPKNNDFEKLMAGAAPFAKRTTIYASANDTILEISRREHGGVARLGVAPDLTFKPDDANHIVDIIDASMAAADRLDHTYYAMSPEVMADMTMALNGVPIETRLSGTTGWPATLKCSGQCPSHYRVNATNGPHFITRMILHLLPIVPLVR